MVKKPIKSVENTMSTSNQTDQLSLWIALGSYLRSTEGQQTIENWAQQAHTQNNWFTVSNCRSALNAIAEHYLDAEALAAWLHKYPRSGSFRPKKVGLIMAGNIPAVGFHDLLCVLISGHRAVVKLSSQDFVLIKEFIKLISDIKPDLGEQIELSERMNHVEALIATGSDNTARYFEYYFSQKPHIIRRNRTSVGVLDGAESAEDFVALGHDVLTYYGLGCRSISKIFVPEGYEVSAFYESIESLGDVILNHKYKNNYDYNKSIYLVNRQIFFDNGFLILKPDDALVSPISVLFYEHYTDASDLAQKLEAIVDKTQCVASRQARYPGSVAFGQTQHPRLDDYADGVDTMQFLMNLGAD